MARQQKTTHEPIQDREGHIREVRERGSAHFAQMWFPHLCRHGFSRMHLESFRRYDAHADVPLWQREGRRLAIAAPRGHAKSTVHTLLMPLLDLCLGREKYIVILSATEQQAVRRLANIKREILGNPRLRESFGGTLSRRALWTRGAIVVNDVRVDAFGALTEIRGLSHGAHRPTKIILDDVEDTQRARNRELRRQLAEWFGEVVENLGDHYTHIEIVGTVLHRDGLLSRLLRRPDFEGRMYQAIEEWSQRQDLWMEWRGKLLNRDDPDRRDSARAYFAQNEAPMVNGTAVLWPPHESYDRLMIQYVTRGRAAFLKEKMNRPLEEESRVFRTANWRYFTMYGNELILVDGPEMTKAERLPEIPRPFGEPADEEHAPANGPGKEEDARKPPAPVRMEDLKFHGFLDPASGKSDKGDFACIVTIGLAQGGAIYVMDVWMDRVGISGQISRACDLHSRYHFLSFGYEANGALGILDEMWRAERTRRNRQGLLAPPPIVAVNHARSSKEVRIASLQTAIANGDIVFSRHLPEEFLHQADEFPNGAHDDGLDALEGAISLIPRKVGGLIYTFGPRESALARL
ncbi:MAG: hypothetical protein K1X53_03960 [Candidatus Sumerlaeaceae bacterium]|nr:hypothetical protein [Candidatus Sumerlaeaceae bacterium]